MKNLLFTLLQYFDIMHSSASSVMSKQMLNQVH